MELYNKTIILEFNGLPGCGKTTTSKLLKDELKKLGYTVGDIYDLQESIKPFRKIKILISIFKLSNMRFIANLLKFTISLKPFKVDRLKYIKITYNNYFMTNNIKNRYTNFDFIISDQGLIQSIISISHLNYIKFDKNIKKILQQISKELDNLYCINCDINIEIAKKRIRNRNLKQGRLDYISDDKLLMNALHSQNINLNILREYFKSINNDKLSNVISTENSVENNINIILKTLFDTKENKLN